MRPVLGYVLVAIGLICLLIGWYGVAGESIVAKQLPYIAIGLASFLTVLLVAIYVFGVPVKGSATTLFTGVVIYIIAATGFGLAAVRCVWAGATGGCGVGAGANQRHAAYPTIPTATIPNIIFVFKKAKNSI